MNKLVFTLLIICSAVRGFSQNSFTFSGKIDGDEATYAKLTFLNDHAKWVTDSCTLQNGAFTFKGNINGGCLATLEVYKAPLQGKSNSDANTVDVFLEDGNITATGLYNQLKGLKVVGSTSNEEYQALHRHIDAMEKELAPISNKFNKVAKELNAAKKQNRGDKVIDSLNNELTAVRKQIDPFAERNKEMVRQFVIAHPNSFVSPREMTVYVPSGPMDSVKLIYNSFSDAVKNSFAGKGIRQKIEAIEAHSANTIAKNFTSADVNGKLISLSDFKGRYVLLDFWGSWCVPCRESTPHLIQLYKKYHPSGLEVIGIAQDDNTPDDWKRAIKKDKTKIWYNILSGWDRSKENNPDDILNKFGIGVFPTKILIDKSGAIAGRYIGIEDTAALDKKLAEIFN